MIIYTGTMTQKEFLSRLRVFACIVKYTRTMVQHANEREHVCILRVHSMHAL
jgi:hypothetical protein